MSEGPLGIINRATSLGPFVKKNLGEAVPDKFEFSGEYADIKSNMPEWGKSKEGISREVMTNRQSKIEDLVETSKREKKEATIPILLNRRTSEVTFDEPHVGGDRRVNPLMAVSDPFAEESTVVGAIHSHPGYENDIEEEVESDKWLSGVHLPSVGDVYGSVFKTSGGYSITGGINGVIAAGGNRDGQGTVWSLYNQETARLVAAFDEDISEEATFAAYNIFISEFTEDISIDNQ